METVMKQIALAMVTAFMSVAAAAQQSPVEVIESAAEELDQALVDRREEFAANQEALYELIDGILLPRFDTRYAAQLVLARHWRSASEEQRQRFIDAFYTSMMEQYADAVLEFDMDQLEVLPYRGDPSSERTMVRTSVQLNDGTTVPVDYVMVKRDSGWKIFDVRIEGISYVRRYRADVDSEVRATSLDEVIRRLEEAPEEIIGSDEEAE
jgi:phospholipid transport system substrate-binding protein